MRLGSAFAAGGAALAAGVIFAAPLAAQTPPGNNGTVKIDDVEFDDYPDNEPHVGCVFQVDFYGYDEGELYAEVLFESQPPTPTGQTIELLTDTVFVGEDDNSGGGSEAGLDASRTYDLSDALAGIDPHPQQGHHVALTINVPAGSQGADVKHKVFWAQGCVPPPTTTPPTTAPPTTAPPTTAPPTTAPPTTAPPTSEGTTTTVNGVVTVPSTTPPTQPTGDLPRTGSSTGTLVGLAAAMVGLGTLGLLAGRRLRSLKSS